MGYVISMEIYDGPGALQRLLLLLGQRNVSFDYFAALNDNSRGIIQVTIGLAGDYGRAAWVTRQLNRHRDVIRTEVVPVEHTEVMADVSVQDLNTVDRRGAVSVTPAGHPDRLTIRGAHPAVEDWMVRHHATAHVIYRWRPVEAGSSPIDHARQHIQGGIRHERKIVLRRQRRSKVVGG